jgi:transposase, IS5 family
MARRRRGPVIADLEKLTGVTVRRIHGDKGYRGPSLDDAQTCG